jgi:hypothetical protein
MKFLKLNRNDITRLYIERERKREEERVKESERE